MVVIAGAIKIALTAFRHRNVIYKVLTAQDRAIGSAFRKGGYSKATQYGARHGAITGTVAGAFIGHNAPDSPGNELQKPVQKRQRVTTSTPYKTHNRFATRSRPERDRFCYPRSKRR